MLESVLNWWVPDDLEELSYLMTSIALILGGYWGLSTWFHAEKLRNLREIESVEGTISTNVAPFEAERQLVTITTSWNNPGVIPIAVDVEKSSLKISSMPASTQEVCIGAESELDTVVDLNPLANKSGLVLEPKTNTQIATHVLLRSGRAFLIEAQIGSLNNAWIWKKTAVLSLINPADLQSHLVHESIRETARKGNSSSA